ncbi:MAG: hypothetical protein EZS28_006712 [Streblomastix strix]|uniref:Uncharacterized protein n=1 Tax=Streblomastix strix TaxID=222440 RepID=A0A5J4WTS0_9EUKA|nr:MAG: hypothetical protein EZS28_006712 [Streblomastix strix]
MTLTKSSFELKHIGLSKARALGIDKNQINVHARWTQSSIKLDERYDLLKDSLNFIYVIAKQQEHKLLPTFYTDETTEDEDEIFGQDSRLITGFSSQAKLDRIQI